jgi:hypothetical protein
MGRRMGDWELRVLGPRPAGPEAITRPAAGLSASTFSFVAHQAHSTDFGYATLGCQPTLEH